MEKWLITVITDHSKSTFGYPAGLVMTNHCFDAIHASNGIDDAGSCYMARTCIFINCGTLKISIVDSRVSALLGACCRSGRKVDGIYVGIIISRRNISIIKQ